jgi:hypothetical protein
MKIVSKAILRVAPLLVLLIGVAGCDSQPEKFAADTSVKAKKNRGRGANAA